MKLNRYKDRKYRFRHSCCRKIGSSGSPILDLNNKVIGIQIYEGIYQYRHASGNFLNYPIKEFIQLNKIMNKKEITAKKNTQKNNLSIQDRLIEKFNLIRKHLGQDIFEKLNELYLSYKISFKISKYVIDYSLNLSTCKNIINQAENFVYKIKLGNKEAICFFCKIPFPKIDNMQSILITNNYILNDEMLNKKDEKIIITNIREEKEIKLSDRRKYISKEYNITIIEIKKEDKIDNYLELDELIIDDILNIKKGNDVTNDLSHFFWDISFYMIGISEIKTGYYLKISEQKKCFEFRCYKKDQQPGTPIFSTRNLKLLGLFDHYSKVFNLGFGILLNYPIKEFIKTNYK